ncbi:AAA family ATPase [Litorivicinus sp.]|nr:AAA family ATPase [Litorivicinus sp.]
MIQKIRFKNLFNSSSYEFSFEKSSEGQGSLLFLTGPNGCGKSTILKAIYTLLCNPALTDEIPPHDLIQIDLTSGASVKCAPERDLLDRSQISFRKTKSQKFKPISLSQSRQLTRQQTEHSGYLPYAEQAADLRRADSKNFRLHQVDEDKKNARLKDILGRLEAGAKKGMSPNSIMLERLGKLLGTHILKAGPDYFSWDGERLSSEGLIDKLKFVIETRSMNDDFSDLISGLNIAYIPATRLHRKFLKEPKSTRDNEDRVYTPVEIALANLQAKILGASYDYYQYARELDSNVPQKILNLIEQQGIAEAHPKTNDAFKPKRRERPDDAIDIPTLFKNAVSEPKEYRSSIADRFNKLSLIHESSDFPDISKNSLNEQLGNLADQILNLMASTQIQGFMKLERIATRMELMLAVLNDLLVNKTAIFQSNSGIELRIYNKDDPSVLVEPTQLSSGEQHLIVLLGQLIFDIEDGSIVLLDEPEISLHPAWQIALRELLEKLAIEKKLTVIIATHSPTLLPPFDDALEHSQIIHLCEEL